MLIIFISCSGFIRTRVFPVGGGVSLAFTSFVGSRVALKGRDFELNGSQMIFWSGIGRNSGVVSYDILCP